MITYLLFPSCFFEIWALSVLQVTYEALYFAHFLTFWALLSPFVLAMCNYTACAQVHKLSQSHCVDKWDATYHDCIYIPSNWLLHGLSTPCISMTFDDSSCISFSASCTLFDSLLPTMCNHTSSAQIHELTKVHCGKNLQGTLSS